MVHNKATSVTLLLGCTVEVKCEDQICIVLFYIDVRLWASRVVQRSKALNRSARGVTTDLGLTRGCITTGREWESHRAVHNWSVLGEGLAGVGCHCK